MAVPAGLATPLAPQGHRPLTQVVVGGLPRMNAGPGLVIILINHAARQRARTIGDVLAALIPFLTAAAELVQNVLHATPTLIPARQDISRVRAVPDILKQRQRLNPVPAVRLRVPAINVQKIRIRMSVKAIITRNKIATAGATS